MSLHTEHLTGEAGRTAAVDVVSIRAPDSKPTNRVFLLFGEHAREFISPESGLHFVRTLCGQQNSLADTAAHILRDSEFMIVVNGNPRSRAKAEQGDFCLRTDPDGVDLNRNWDEKWMEHDSMDESTNPGPQPFSEPETQIFKDLVSKFNPTTFLTVHSGTKGMYMPWAYDMKHQAVRNRDSMMQVLASLDQNHCQCPFGAAGAEVGYPCPGTCLDWVYDKLETPFTFAFEIYVNPDMEPRLTQRWQRKIAANEGLLHQANNTLAHPYFKDFFQEYPSSFIQLSSGAHRHRVRADDAAAECFANFNPATEEVYNSVVDNWSQAYLQLADMVASKLKEQE